MKIRFISLISGMVLFSCLAFAQGACYPAGVVLLDTGRPANGATVSVCSAGGTFPGCTSTTSLFTTPALSVAASNPVTTDAHGNFGFCAAAGVNYDLQITGTGITPLTIKNLPLPPTSPITAASLTSSSANPANVGLIKLASGDCLDWRNNANTGNIQLCKTAADAFDMTAFNSVLTPNVVVNPSALGTNAALTIGGTSPTTGGISVFVGALGSQNERLSVVPADASSAAVRVGALSVRAPSGGFLTGTELAKIDTTGAISGLSLALGGGTALTTTNRTGTGNLVLATSPTISSPAFTSPSMTSPTINTGVSQGSGFKHQRFGATCTTAATAGTACTSTYTWTAAFADTSYTAVCQGEGNVGGAAALFINARTATQVSVQVVTFTSTAVSFTAVDCIAAHD